MITEPRINLELAPKQIEYYQMTNPALGIKYRCLAGSTGSGKTDGLIRIKVLKALRYQGIITCWFRKNLTTIRSTTLPSIIQVLQDMNLWRYCTYRKSPELVITLPNGSEFWFRQADRSKDPEYKAIRGLQITDAVLEEADEMEEKVFSILLSRVGRWKNTEYGIDGEIDLVLNPSNGWVKTRFYEPYMAGTLAKPFGFFEMSARDNPYLSESFFESLSYMTPEDQERYLNNNWNYRVNNNALIPYEWLKKVLVDEPFVPEGADTLLSLGMDVAGEGDDETIYAFSNGHCLTHFVKGQHTSKIDQAYEVMRLADNDNIPHRNVIIDTIGEGSGVMDMIRHYHLKATPFKASNKPRGKGTFYTFGNKRAENFWKLRELIQHQQYFIVKHDQFIKEITSIDYFQKDDGTLFIEPKDKIKAKLGKSPDYADSASMAIDPLIDLITGQGDGLRVVA